MRFVVLSAVSLLGLSAFSAAEAAPRPKLDKSGGTVACMAIGCPKPSLPQPPKPAQPAASPFSDACKYAKCAFPREPKVKPVMYCIKAPCPQPGKPRPRPDDTAHPSKPAGGTIYCIKAPCPQRRG